MAGGNREGRRPSWWDRYDEEELTCVRCLETWPKPDLDRLLWCERCRTVARARAMRWGSLVGVGIALVLGAWIWLDIRPSRDLVMGGWIATVVAAGWLAAKITRELVYGVDRFKNRRAVEASPPEPPPPAPPEAP